MRVHCFDYMHDDLNFGVTLDNGNDENAQNTHRSLQTSSNFDLQQPSSPYNDGFTVGKEDYDLKRAGHPNVCIATVAFKGTAFFLYFFHVQLHFRPNSGFAGGELHLGDDPGSH